MKEYIMVFLNSNFLVFLGTCFIGYMSYRLQKNIFLISHNNNKIRDLYMTRESYQQELYQIYNKDTIDLNDYIKDSEIKGIISSDPKIRDLTKNIDKINNDIDKIIKGI